MKLLLPTLFACALAMPAAAASVFESDAPTGDYADAFGASTNNLGATPVGASSILGGLSCNSAACTGGLNDSFDAFYFEVTPGTQIISYKIGTEGGSDPFDPQNPLTVTAELRDGGGATVFAQTFDINTSISPGIILGPDTYNFGISFGNIVDFADGGGASYTITSETVSVAAVPVPASLPFLLAGVGGLIALRRRTRAA